MFLSGSSLACIVYHVLSAVSSTVSETNGVTIRVHEGNTEVWESSNWCMRAMAV
jgi:hypothetical protein